MILCEWILQQLGLLNCKHVFLVPGGELDPIVGALGAQKTINPVVACHEEGAGFMADGYARTGYQLGVCMGIGAPGAANLLPALLAASSDRSKLLCLTGGSATNISGKGGFQDSSVDGTEDALLIKPAVRYSESCSIANHIAHKWQSALQAINGNLSGVAHMTIPKDVQEAAVPDTNLNYQQLMNPRHLIDIKAIHALVKNHLHEANIALLVGRGAVLSQAGEALQRFVEQYQIPFATTFAAKGILPESHPLCLGMFGYAGHKRAIETLLGDEIKTLIVLGSSLNARDTLCWSKELAQNKTIIQIDYDAAMLNRNYPVNMAIQSDCRGVLEYLNQLTIPELNKTLNARQAWTKKIGQIEMFYKQEKMQAKDTPLEPAMVIRTLNLLAPDNTLCFIDSGAHRAFAGHYWLTKSNGRVISATNLGPMGWAIPASIGGKLASPDQPVVTITGDGCMRMHGIEIATAARYQIPVVFVVLNNQALGNVYLREKTVNAGAMEMTRLPDIDWIKFAEALGVEGATVKQPHEIESAIQQGLQCNKPFVINVIVNRDATTPVEPYQEMVKEWQER